MRTHKGRRLIERKSPTGHRTYLVPEDIADQSISEIIRQLSADGWSRWEIHENTGIRYQHVRNVLEQLIDAGSAVLLPAISTESDARTNEPNSSDDDAPALSRSGQTIADVLAEARARIAAIAGVSEEAVKLDLRLTSS